MKSTYFLVDNEFNVTKLGKFSSIKDVRDQVHYDNGGVLFPTKEDLIKLIENCQKTLDKMEPEEKGKFSKRAEYFGLPYLAERAVPFNNGTGCHMTPE